MSRIVEHPDQFTVIGENIHATRVLRRDGIRAATVDDGTEAITYRGPDGETRYLTVPGHFKETQPYQQGQYKHFMIAVWKGVHGDDDERANGTDYVEREVERQIAAGADFLDLNVDEVSHIVDEQKRSMRWLVETVQQVSTVPPSVDSSLSDVIAEGLAVYDRSLGRPLLNSVALERIDALDLVTEHDTHVVLTAAGREGMPSDADERVENVGELVEAALGRGIAPGDIHIDALVFPIAVSAEYGLHYLDAVAAMRKQFGNEIHISGGLSNVSFGLPNRRLVNDTFLHLALEYGADSGIIDPVQTNVGRALNLDTDSERVKISRRMLMGEDDFCMEYISAHRSGALN